MPYKDPDKRKAKGREYARDYLERKRVEGKPEGLCSVASCARATTGGNKKCDHHLAYMREYKKKYRAQPKAEGLCSFPDCKRLARPGFKLCTECNEYSKAQQRRPENLLARTVRNQTIQEEVFAAYGGGCGCCPVTQIEFLSIDHIDGYKEGPRKGNHLYRWLKTNGFPPGYRVLCMNCNFALGHHNYCPHGDLVGHGKIGRPEKHFRLTPEQKIENRLYWISYKLEVFDHYGGCRCSCCGEPHHEFLQMDHTENNGAAHRKELTGDAQDGRNLVIWLKKQGYPPGYQVLCANCNYAKGHFGACPHEALRA